MPRHVWRTLGLTFMTLLITGASCLKNVRLEVIPELVEHGHEAILRCSYELEDAPLYSLKWYRGTYEFYRYSPNEKPATKIFNFTWIEVNPNNSNESQVTIQNVDFPLSGNFSCEVTTDAPTFSTASSVKTLTVVSVPKGKPVIVSERGRYEPGETLKANCSAPPSKPPVQLSFTLNDLQVGEPSQPSKRSQSKQRELNSITHQDRHDDRQQQQQQHRDEEDERQWTELSLHLQPFHYSHGQLNLRCTAKIPGVYEQSSEVQLGSSLREPVPERVTSENASDNCRRAADFTILALILLLLLHLR
ncbi:uncharacterized protein LOC100119624 isoform X2 [Nasonia vitripennis]|uniref:Ig-like domain-containing protein n=1 Tax=Nasonia vitripennis TaxID=7425 RepID=A0A7M7G4T2_NASVI|nr:uncharacterized protein LOC100119624 isoform X2 [Nasonia vitripennis]XP_032456344.1 uncharacterized protein LOC100119624 isoform X2 [Nasonia vitripennis]